MMNETPFFSQAIITAKQNELAEVQAVVKDIHVHDAPSLNAATDLLRSILQERDVVEAMRKSATKPINESLALINSWFKPVVGLCDVIASQLKSQVAEYSLAQRALQERAYKDAAIAHAAGDNEQARAALTVASQTTPETPTGTTIREQWAMEIADANLIPREYLTPDLIAIGRALRAAPTDQPPPVIAGLRISLRAIVSQRR